MTEKTSDKAFSKARSRMAAPAVTAALFFLGALLLIDAVSATVATNMHTGIILTYIIGALFSVCGALRLLPEGRVPKAVRYLTYVFYAGAAASFVLVSAVFIYGMSDNVTFDEDAVIVLGAAVRGREPAPALSRRLDAAVEYHRRAPDALIVVSGGQGDDEEISEADAMEEYLIARGVPAAVIVKEDASTSTRENFLFSERRLRELLGDDFSAAYITSDYHVFRAGRLASRAGIDGAAHMHSTTPLYLMFPNGLREVVAVTVQTLNGNI